MKNLIYRLFCLIILTNLSLSRACAATAQEADDLAREGKFAEAATIYEEILTTSESAELYYNLGYCHFKSNNLGKAILNFERSRRLNPSDPDVIANLDLAYSLTDKMQVVEPIFFQQWWTSFCNLFSSDGWAIAFIVLFVLSLCSLGCFLFMDSVSIRKAGFFSSIALFLFAISSLVISLQKRSEILNSSAAIIMSSSVNLQTSPDKNGSQMTVLHEGTRVDILDQLGDWIEVKLKDGNVGWLRLAEVEKI